MTLMTSEVNPQAAGSGAVGGWQIWRPPVREELVCAPVPLASIRPPPTRLAMNGEVRVRRRAEICFRFGRSLPDYDAPYTREQIRAPIESCHPAVAALQPPPTDPGPSDPTTDVATGCGHWLLIYGKPSPGWPALGCHGQFVEQPDEIHPARERAAQAMRGGWMALVNVVTDSRARSANGTRCTLRDLTEPHAKNTLAARFRGDQVSKGGSYDATRRTG